MASVRSLDNALETDTIPAGMLQAKITNDNGTTQIPNNGRIIRNLIHGADTVMSHITHFYALAALDFVDVSYLGPIWDPTYEGATPSLVAGSTPMPNGKSVQDNYTDSLIMRRKMHTASAIFSGRHPIQNAIVPGGVTTLPTASDVAAFSVLLDTVRNFINTAYIPDVVTVACLSAYSGYWLAGTMPGNLLSYGEYPIQTGTSAERLLLKRGLITGGVSLNQSGTSLGPTDFLANVREYIDYSYYDIGGPYKVNNGLYPGDGVTVPDVTKVGYAASPATAPYSWLKAPRYTTDGTNALACEVGPLARMVATYLQGVAGDAPVVSGAPTASGVLVGGGALGLPVTTYTAKGLVDTALSVVGGRLSITAAPSHLLSILGRHACRALECKYVADAMADTGSPTTQQAWLSELQTNLTAPVYVYAKLPTKPKKGAGWAEAPRGALGHWITIEKKRITNYQCVVPSTWNHGPKDKNNTYGPAEAVIVKDAPAISNNDTGILTLLRYLHPYDFCIACAVHVVGADGKTVHKFRMETDGRVTKLPHDAEI